MEQLSLSDLETIPKQKQIMTKMMKRKLFGLHYLILDI